MKPVYVDLYELEEDQRIDQIGHVVQDHGKTAAFITDADPGKSQRYIRKLLAKFPGVEVISKHPGPVPNTVTVKVGPKP
jgi:hypothetical protein